MSQNSRMVSRHKRKKSNTLLNILIGVVLILIVTVVWNIVSDDEETVKEVEQENSTSVEQTEQETTIEEEDKELVAQEIEEEDVDSSSDSETETESQNSSNEAPETEQQEEVRTESSDDPNVLEVEINQNWLPIGTSQTGEHVSIYDPDSVDWKEKVSAIAYATKLNESDMYIKFIGNGGSPQKSVGTVTSKDNKEIYRVYLEWIDGQGWKPTKKETLKALP